MLIRWFLVVGGFLITIAILAFVVGYSYLRSVERDLEDAVDRWATVGGVTSLRELQPVPIAPKENAAFLYEKAFALEREYRTNGGHDFREPIEDIELLRQKLVPCREIIETTSQASKQEQCIWKTDYYTNPEFSQVKLPYLALTRSLARILAADALVRAEDVDYSHAILNIETMLHMAQHVRSEPGMIQTLVSLGIEQLALNHLEIIFYDCEVPQTEILSILNIDDYRISAKEALIADGAGIYQFFTNQDVLLNSNSGYEDKSGLWIMRELVQYLDLMTEYVRLTESPYFKVESPCHAIFIPNEPWSLAGFLPATCHFLKQIAMAESRYLLISEAFKLREYRKEHCEYPAKWDMPINPLTGEPLEYEKTTEGFHLIGDIPDTEDDYSLEWEWH